MAWNIREEKIEISNDVPLYRQLENIIMKQIKGGRLRPGDILPSEHEFCTNFKISRSTVRQALKSLEEREVIVRRRGIGTMLAEPKAHRKLGNLYSFTKQMREMGYQTRSKVLDFTLNGASKEIAGKMQIKEHTPVFIFSRLRIADEQPMLLEKTVIVQEFCPDLKPEWLEEGSLYTMLTDQYHLDMYYAVESYEPIFMGEEATRLLACNENRCAFQIQRKAYIRTGKIFELTESIMPGKRSKLEITLYKDKISLNRM